MDGGGPCNLPWVLRPRRLDAGYLQNKARACVFSVIRKSKAYIKNTSSWKNARENHRWHVYMVGEAAYMRTADELEGFCIQRTSVSAILDK